VTGFNTPELAINHGINMMTTLPNTREDGLATTFLILDGQGNHNILLNLC
jgi:hypothetical protein